MVLKLQRYNLRLHHLPGKQLQVADTLSRAPLDTETVDTRDIDDSTGNIAVFSLFVATPGKLSVLKTNSLADLAQVAIKKLIAEGWPAHKHQCPDLVKSYWPIRHELHVLDNLLFWKTRLVVPAASREDLLNVLHSSHQGVVATKHLAAASLYWPGMSSMIEGKVLSCPTCQQFQRNNSNGPLLPHVVPQRPWQKLGVDLFHLNQQVYLVIIDYFSKFVDLHLLPRADSAHVIAALKSSFARYGIPEEFVSDNGPPFDSRDMRALCYQWSINHTTSSPGYPRSNGMVERAIQTVKRLLKKAIESNSDPYLVLLQYRCTPASDLPSPAEMLFGRRLRTLIPAPSDVYQTTSDKDNRRALLRRQDVMISSPCRVLPPLRPGQRVNMRTQTGWAPATVVSVGPYPRSYEVVDTRDRHFRRNRVHLRSVPSSGEMIDAQHPAIVGTSQSDVPQIRDSSGQTFSSVFTRSGRRVIPPARYRD